MVAISTRVIEFKFRLRKLVKPTFCQLGTICDWTDWNKLSAYCYTGWCGTDSFWGKRSKTQRVKGWIRGQK